MKNNYKTKLTTDTKAESIVIIVKKSHLGFWNNFYLHFSGKIAVRIISIKWNII